MAAVSAKVVWDMFYVHIAKTNKNEEHELNAMGQILTAHAQCDGFPSL